jgi:hypothetical protein
MASFLDMFFPPAGYSSTFIFCSYLFAATSDDDGVWWAKAALRLSIVHNKYVLICIISEIDCACLIDKHLFCFQV